MTDTIVRSLASLILACVTGLAPGTLVRADVPPVVEPTKLWLPEIKVETYKLENGLTVVLHVDDRAPLVAVHITYNVGSKDDPPGRSGLAHLFEHLMFEGSQHADSSYYWPIYPYLADARGATGRDRTDYHATVTRNALERTLWLEADRMGFLMPAVTDDKRVNACDVVANERRQTVEELPLGQVDEAWSRELYPPGHPYRHLIIGSLDDVSAVTLADLNAFSQRHYAPDNAFLCLAGNFEPGQAKRWIRKYFGPLRPGPLAAPTVRQIVPELAQPRQITLTDHVSHPHILLIWPTVPANHPDEAAIDVLAAVLGGDTRWNRLFRALTHDRQVATRVSASHPTHLLAGTFEVDLVARTGQNLDEMIRLADAEIERLKRDGPTPEEIHRVQIERTRLQGIELESVTGKARILSDSAAAYGDPLAYQRALSGVLAVTPEDVRRVARAYLRPARIEVKVTSGPRTFPRKSGGPAADNHPPVTGRTTARDDPFDRSITPDFGPPVTFVPPLIKRRWLSNGLDLRIVERHDSPTVNLTLVIKSGETSAPRGKDGLGLLTVRLLEEGTKSRTTFQLESELIEIGATIATEGLMESSTISMTTLTRTLARSLDLYADVVLNPSFADAEYLRLKLGRLAELADRSDNAEQIADDLLPRLLYHPEHPFARARLGTLESITAITREDVIDFYEHHYVPGNASLVVVGDVDPEQIVTDLEARFGGWAPGPIPQPPALPPTPWPAADPAIYLIDKPGATQSVVSIGRIAASINSPDRHGLLVLNENLKGHVNSNLRDDRADTYGFSSTIDFRNDLGPFVLTGSVPTSRTAQTLVAIFKDMKDLADAKPITEEELTTIRKAMVPEWINRFETIADVATEVAYLVSHELPDDHFALESDRFNGVTQTDVDWLAQHLLAPRWMTVLVVGDRSRIERSLRDFPLGKPVHLLDSAAKPIRKRNAARLRATEPLGKSTRR